MNRHIIIGNLTRDPEIGAAPSGAHWTRFVVAVNKRYRREGEPEADFMRVTCWNALADNCAKYLSKGKKVAVVGESTAHGWTSREGDPRAQIEITAQEVEFLTPSGSGLNNPPEEPAWNQSRGHGDGAQDPDGTVVNPEDLPY